jgi:hypothetical protein
MPPTVYLPPKRRKGTAWQANRSDFPAFCTQRSPTDSCALDFEEDDDDTNHTIQSTMPRIRRIVLHRNTLSPGVAPPEAPTNTAHSNAVSTEPSVVTNNDGIRQEEARSNHVETPSHTMPNDNNSTPTPDAFTCKYSLRPLDSVDIIVPTDSSIFVRWEGLLGSLWEARVLSYSDTGGYHIQYLYDGQQEWLNPTEREAYSITTAAAEQTTTPSLRTLQKGDCFWMSTGPGEVQEMSILAQKGSKVRVWNHKMGKISWIPLLQGQEVYTVAMIPSETTIPVRTRRTRRHPPNHNRHF